MIIPLPLRRRAGLIAIVAAAVTHTAALGQSPPPLQGTWELSNAARDRSCLLEFKADPAPGGLLLQPNATCATAFPSIKELAAWKVEPNAVLRLLDGKRGTLLELTEVEGGMYEGERRGEGLYFLQSQAAVNAGVRVEQMFGDWTITRGATKCPVTLLNELAGVDDFKVVVKPGCNAAIATLGLEKWRLERGELMLAGKSETWRFEEVDTVTWRRIPRSEPPVQLVKK